MNQGLWGAFQQYFTVEEKPRLTRRNTYFEDRLHTSNDNAILMFGMIVFCVIVSLIVGMML